MCVNESESESVLTIAVSLVISILHHISLPPTLTNVPIPPSSLITIPGGKPNQMQFLARNHQAVSHKYSMHEGLFTHGVNYELAVEHHDRMKQAKKMMAKGVTYCTSRLSFDRL